MDVGLGLGLGNWLPSVFRVLILVLVDVGLGLQDAEEEDYLCGTS